MSYVSRALSGGEIRSWVSGRTYIAGQQVISPTDFCAYVRKTNGAGATDPSSDSTNWQQLSQTIKSIQRGVIGLSSSPTTATITSVNTSKSILTNLGWSGSGSIDVKLQLTNSTTITAEATGVTSSQVGYQIVEYY